MTTKKVATEKVAKKVVPKKETTSKKEITIRNIDEVILKSYSMKMVIPTGQYANIQPEIIVEAYSMDKAHDFISSHMNKLWKEYYLINERRPEPIKAATPAPTPASNPVSTQPPAKFEYLPDPKGKSVGDKPLTKDELLDSVGGKIIGESQEVAPTIVQPPASGVAFAKAKQAIDSCLSLDVLSIIEKQVDKSVKLSQEDKEALQPLLLAKSEELFDGK